jgi:hypothetical protein
MAMSELMPEAPADDREVEGIDLRNFLRANESEIRWVVESLIVSQMTRAIGRDNLGKINLIFDGSFVGNLTVYVEGPADLKAKVEEALRKPSRRVHG